MIESGQGCLGNLKGAPTFSLAWGRSQNDSDLFYDLASLTKVVLTNSLLLQFLKDSKLSVAKFRESQLSSFLKQAPSRLQNLKIGNIWDHRAGMQSHFLLDPLKSRMAYSGDRNALWKFVLEQVSVHLSEDAEEVVYSDLDYWILGALLENFYRKDLRELWQDFKKTHALPSNDLVFGPLKENVIPSETRHSLGVVNDDNACFMQGIAPHAGLFSTKGALWSWMQLMHKFYVEDQEYADFFVPAHEHRFWCGWDRPSGELTQAGTGASEEHVIGHLGYTGTALWWNPMSGLGGLLLTNRVYPSHCEESRQSIKLLRNKFFSVLWASNSRDVWDAFLKENKFTQQP